MNIEDEIVKELSTHLQSEIDFQILSDMLVQLGWHKVHLIELHNTKQAADIKQWMTENTKSHWENRGSTFVFHDSGDAVNFTLRWK
jgi:hypothetical protein